MSSSIVQDKSEQFSLRIIKLYKYLSERTVNREKILSLQLLRSGTSIGANIAESECAISKNDFKAKLYISLKECNECKYWLRLLYKAGFLEKAEYDSIYKDAEEIYRLLMAIAKTLKEQKNIKSEI